MQWKFWEGNNINNWTLKEAVWDSALLGFLSVKKTPFTFTKFQKQRRKEMGKKKKEKEYATGNFNSYSKYW